eukprot:TRINITY_DN10554_c0_g1_i3.p1 TRINITY_DN10554_c0_g1~~TRINITY_DN10554_c0_g1_i3.p1  ORF type:complete len:202 (+),score=70.20 TRINITY_DN10554_c0_g1_i3:72-608(+)
MLRSLVGSEMCIRDRSKILELSPHVDAVFQSTLLLLTGNLLSPDPGDKESVQVNKLEALHTLIQTLAVDQLHPLATVPFAALLDLHLLILDRQPPTSSIAAGTAAQRLQPELLLPSGLPSPTISNHQHPHRSNNFYNVLAHPSPEVVPTCLLYTSDAADEEDSVDLGGRRFITKKKIK